MLSVAAVDSEVLGFAMREFLGSHSSMLPSNAPFFPFFFWGGGGGGRVVNITIANIPSNSPPMKTGVESPLHEGPLSLCKQTARPLWLASLVIHTLLAKECIFKIEFL